MSFKRIVNVVEVLALVAAVVFVVLLFTNGNGGGGNGRRYHLHSVSDGDRAVRGDFR